jgi:hypothetical protein
MKTMKRTTKILLAAALFTLWMLSFSPKASAMPRIFPPQFSSALNFGDGHELGTVAPDNPQGDADRVNYVNFMLALALGHSGTDHIGPHSDVVTRTMNMFSPLPAAILPVGGLTNGTGTTINLTTLGTFDYLFAHYGGPHGGTSFVWDISSFTGGTITIPAALNRYGLSGWSLIDKFTPTVPDGGATIMLLGLALSALGMVRRCFLKS